MEPNQKAERLAQSFSLRKAHDFLESIKQELSKIHWTDGEEARVYAKIVVGATFFFGMAIYFSDVVIQRCLHMLDTVFRWIFG